MRMLTDANFIDLARVAIAATLHSPERAQAMVAATSCANFSTNVTVTITNWLDSHSLN